jgi:AcrR family transcriptional regulator
MPTPKKITHENLELPEAIRHTAWKQIAEQGASSLNLRAIARELKVTAPALYNYFPRRDDLVTALIVEAFTSFGDGQIAARASVAADDHAGSLRAIGLAYRQWAHTFPQRYQLIFGVPIPGYVPPPEKIFPSSARSISALFGVVEAIRAAGRLQAEAVQPLHKDYEMHFELWRTQLGEVHPATHFVAMIIWARVHGLVSLEIQGNLPLFGETGDALYRTELDALVRQFIKE